MEKDFETLITTLENDTSIMMEWFKINEMKANSDKSHVVLNTNEICEVTIDGSIILNSQCEKLLGVSIDYNLKFDKHVSQLCVKAIQKLNALARMSPYMNLIQRRSIKKAFISSQFGHCPLV